MGMARFLDFWRDYFSIALGMASGSLLSFLFMNIFSKISR
jgi:membrane protein DedA with SNARE-associated domain